jgi:hypothetical protein
MSENGNNGKWQVILTMDRDSNALDIGGNVQNIDILLNILSQATRFLDVQYRVAAGIQAQQKVNQQRQSLDVAMQLFGKR